MLLRFHPIEVPFDGTSRRPRATLGALLYDSTHNHELTASRAKHPTIGRFLKPTMANKAAAQLVNNSSNPRSPTKGFLLFDGVKKLDKLVGVATVTDEVDVYQKDEKCKVSKLLRASFCVTWLGMGGAEELREACALTRGLAKGSEIITIEPVGSSPIVHVALEQVFGGSAEGRFGAVTSPSVLKPSILYGLPNPSKDLV